MIWKMILNFSLVPCAKMEQKDTLQDTSFLVLDCSNISGANIEVKVGGDVHIQVFFQKHVHM